MVLPHALYSTIPGSPTCKLTSSYFSGVSDTINLEDGSIAPDAPNIITVMTDDKSHFATVKYGAKTDGALTDLEVIYGAGYLFKANSAVAVRNYTHEDDVGIKQNIIHTEQRVSALEGDVNAVSGELSAHISNKTNPHDVTKSQIGLGNVDNTSDEDKPISSAAQEALTGKVDKVTGASLVPDAKITAYDAHLQSTGNPHSVTKNQVGLGNVDNTADLDKPISTAVQTALDDKASVADFNAHTTNKSNPHEVTKAQVGLGNVEDGAQINVIESIKKNGVVQTIINKEINLVLSKSDVSLGNADNTSDADKPVSTATQTALDDKVDKVSGSSLVPDTKVEAYDAHLLDTGNPHAVTKSQVGLGNTEDGAQINVIESIKKNGTALTIVNKEVDITLSKGDVGLGNVDNTSDANKPISTATQTALDEKVSGVVINGTELTKDANKKSALNFGAGLIYDSPTATVKAVPPEYPVYGFQIDESNSDPSACVTRIGYALSDADVLAVFLKKIRPCVVKNAVRQFYVSDTDWSKKEDGVTSSGVLDGTSLDGDFMNEYPTFWWKVTTISANVHQVEFVWGKTERVGWVTPHIYDGQLIDNIYGGVYEAYESDGILRSIHSESLLPTVSKTNQAFRNSAQNSARGSNASRYTIDMPLIYMMKLILKIWLYKTIDFQSKVARGIVDDGSSAVGRRPLAYQMNTAGQNLITQGTPATSQAYTDNKAAVVAREVNPYGHVWKHWVGCAYRYNELAIALDGHDTVDVTSITTSNWDSKTANWHVVGEWFTSAGYTKNMTWDSKFPFAPKTTNGSATTYYSDYAYRNTADSPTSRTPRCCIAGASWYDGSSAGPFYLAVSLAVGRSDSNIGSRLHCFGAV